jgi:hypothetical protein
LNMRCFVRDRSKLAIFITWKMKWDKHSIVGLGECSHWCDNSELWIFNGIMEAMNLIACR